MLSLEESSGDGPCGKGLSNFDYLRGIEVLISTLFDISKWSSGRLRFPRATSELRFFDIASNSVRNHCLCSLDKHSTGIYARIENRDPYHSINADDWFRVATSPGLS